MKTETTQERTNALVYIDIDNIRNHPDNPRKDLGDLTELSESIKANGILQNLTIVPRFDPATHAPVEGAEQQEETGYYAVIGNRRLAAAALAGLKKVPCILSNMDHKEQVRTMLMENMQRSDLTVYEQAQGFQMMLDLGSTIEEISKESGFSATTVRRRVKMMELDQSTLKKVSDRQLSFFDFDRLAQIEDIKARNKCLEDIGTSSFDQGITTQLRRQAIKKNLPMVKKLLKDISAKPIKQNDTWSCKYESIGPYLQIEDWKEDSSLVPKKVSGQLFYYLDEQYGSLRLFEERKKAKPVKRSAKEIEREKRIAAAWESVNEKTAVAYEMRSNFIKSISWSKKNAELILRGAMIASILKAIDYMSSDNNGIGKALGLDMSKYDSARGVKAISTLRGLPEKEIPTIIYALFDDGPKEGFSAGYKGEYPQYKASSKLGGLYEWITSLGYEMSDEEKAMQDGSHELFAKDDKEADA